MVDLKICLADLGKPHLNFSFQLCCSPPIILIIGMIMNPSSGALVVLALEGIKEKTS